MNVVSQQQLTRLIEIPGVWQILFPISGMCAEQRGASAIELIDMVKAIFIVDLEHVSGYWNNWLGFERFVLDIPLADGRKQGYINRCLYVMSWHLAHRDNAGTLMFHPSPSPVVNEIVISAQGMASTRGLPPSSCDLLLCICQKDRNIAEALQTSGLQLPRLASDFS